MSIFNVVNVGQGDCIIIDPPSCCKLRNGKVFIDLGPGAEDVTKYIKPEDEVNIVITHHDADHLNGIRYFVDKLNQVSIIYLPLYQNEITIIAKSILQLKGIQKAENCDDFIRNLEDIVYNQRFLYEILCGTHKGPRLGYLYEGAKICGHLYCLNPPKYMKVYRWIGEANQDQLSDKISKLFEHHYAQELSEYLFSTDSKQSHNNNSEGFGTIKSLLLDNDRTKREFDYDGSMGKSYIIDFFIDSYEIVEGFNSNPSRRTLAPLYENFIKRTHDACVVLKAEYEGKTFLLTGDASKKVFYRIMQQDDKLEQNELEADYLKIPHHGSKDNIDEKILDRINPDMAIISHNNRFFGKAKDSHPNIEVLKMLQERDIRILITNDVIKHDIVVMEKRNHTHTDRFINVL